jgi:hypothetical protein
VAKNFADNIAVQEAHGATGECSMLAEIAAKTQKTRHDLANSTPSGISRTKAPRGVKKVGTENADAR